jgi:hypothetical protein
MRLKKKARSGKPVFTESAGTQELLRRHRVERARVLDRFADAELQQGHHAAAEHLANRAAELRGAGA